MGDPNPLDQARHIHATYAAALERARRRHADGITGPRARDQEIARAYRDARRALAHLQGEHDAQRRAHRERLQRKLFGIQGNPTSLAIIAHRDAADRAARLGDTQEAKALLKRALRSGDDSLARAVVAHAAEQGWGDVLSTYYADKPAERALYDEWARHVRDDNNPQARFNRASAFLIPTPTELSKLQDHQIDQLARDAGDHATTTA